MRQIFILEDLDCANCAAKIEKETGELEGVTSASVNLLAQKMTVEMDDGREKEVFKAVKAIVKKYEPDVSVSVK